MSQKVPRDQRVTARDDGIQPRLVSGAKEK